MKSYNRSTPTRPQIILGGLSLCSIFYVYLNNITLCGRGADQRAQHVHASKLSNLGLDTDNRYERKDTVQGVCASWLPKENRRVLFVELHTWEKYYSKGSRTTGEYYLSASWDHALRKIGFTVDRVSHSQYYEKMTLDEIGQYYRIFVRDPRWHSSYDHHDILCKVRPMYYYGEWYKGKRKENYRFNWSFDEKQIVVAHPGDRNTFLGYFPHNILSDDLMLPTAADRGRVGLFYGKKPEYFEPYTIVIEALIEAGFTLHTTCKDEVNNTCPFPAEVVRHKNVGPTDYASLMRQFSFMLGFGYPLASPSPLVGVSYGVAFLNPLRPGSEDTAQHSALSRLGMPYVYTVDLADIEGVVRAATHASTYRFSSYVPPEFRVNTLIDRMCALIEDNALCTCPNPLFGDDTLDFDRRKNVDCRASSSVKKGPVYPPLREFD